MVKKHSILGNSTNVTIGKKAYSSNDAPKKEGSSGDGGSNARPASSSEKIPKIQSNLHRQTGITVTPQTIIRSKPVLHGFERPTFTKAGVLTNVKTKMQSVLNSQNDNGTSTVSTAITGSFVGIKTFKAAQTATPYAIKTTQGAYNVGAKTIKVLRTVDSTIARIQNGTIQLNQQTMLQFKAIATQKIKSTQPMQRLYRVVTGVRTAVSTTRRYGIMVGQGTMKAITVTRGVLTGTVKVHITKLALQGFRNATFKGVKLSGRVVGSAVKTSAERGLKTGFGGLRRGSKGIATGIVGVGDMLAATEDMGAQTIGLSIKSAHYTVKFIKTTPKIFRYGARSVNTGVKRGKSIYRAGKGVVGIVKRFGKLGIKDTVRYYRAKALKALAKAGGSGISAIIQGLRSVGMKFVAPIILIVVVVVTAVNIANAPASGIGAIFGGAFTNKDTNVDYDVHTFLEGAVEPKKQDLVAKLIKMRNTNLISNGGAYYYVRLFNGANNNEIDFVDSSILGAIYTSPELVSIIEPIFQTVILTKYNLEPTQAQIDSTLNDIWNNLIVITTTELPPIYVTVYDGTDEYGNPMSHIEKRRVLGITITLDGYYQLLAKYFTNEIDRLSNLSTRTSEENLQLQTLKDNYELCLSYMDVVLQNYSNSPGGGDISGVVFKNGSRPNNDAIIGIATMQLGNVGGQPFWSWYGFNGRVEWCATFISWCGNQMGNITNGKVPKFSYCPDGVQWFKNHNQWAAGRYQEPVAGDIIFFDWGGDGVSDHVGFVVGNDGVNVYTIVGNSGDVCRRRSYPINSSVIYGYGLPNY